MARFETLDSKDGRRVPGVVLLVIVGVLLGWLTSAANHGYVPGGPHLPKLIGSAWAWLAATFLVSWPAHQWTDAFWRGMQFLIPAVFAYYTADLLSGTYDQVLVESSGAATIDVLGLIADVVAYLVIGTLAAGGLAVVVVGIRRGGIIGLLAGLVIPAYFAYTGFAAARVSSHDVALQSVATWVGTLGAAAGVALMVFAASRWVWLNLQ